MSLRLFVAREPLEGETMSVITTGKTDGEVLGHLMKRRDLPVAVVGCDKCAKTGKAGGADEAKPHVYMGTSPSTAS